MIQLTILCWKETVRSNPEDILPHDAALNPAVQEKAQVQIDAVVGKDRFPTMDDRPWLPYIDVICRETLRYVSDPL
ncbi:hypothetical protein V8E55_007984 [Tylopilus felleus]